MSLKHAVFAGAILTLCAALDALPAAAQPMESVVTRSFGEVSLVLMPAKNSTDANRTTPST